MDKLILNVVHRPEMVPEYAEKVTGQSKNVADGADNKGLLSESLDIFKLQQQIAHKNNIKTTIQMTYSSLFNDEAVELAKEHNKQYGDEISLTLLGLPCKQFSEKYKTKDFCIWMFSEEDKKTIADDVFGLFYQKFGFYPQSTGSYYMDAFLIDYIKTKYPSVKCAVATCWEEGPKAYRTCNNSWYTFFDGGPWNPWIPSKQNTHAPAEDETQDSGIVAIPHLSRDLIACFDGNGSNFGTHPQNVLRGMIYEDGKYPYLFNIIDQYRALSKYNDGYCYNMMFVGPGWMNKMGRWEANYELLVKSYEDGMAYYAQLKKEGLLTDLTMAEFADYYRGHKTYKQPECALWKDILYGSDKQVFWYCDPYMRTCADMNQGGALIDLRPYVAKLERKVGIGTGNIHDASYPYLIQSMYRAGYFTHYAGEGTIKSCKIGHNGQQVDLCLCRTHAKFEKDGESRLLKIDPVTVEFNDGLNVTVATTYCFEAGSSAIKIKREITEMSDITAQAEITEYITACYGTNEYPEDMSGITLFAEEDGKTKSLRYEYKCRELSVQDSHTAGAVIPQIKTRLTVSSEQNCEVFVKEGYAFSPMFTVGLTKNLKYKESLISWLRLEKAD